MKLMELAERMGARVEANGSEQAEIVRFYAGDRMSDILREVGRDTLLVTGLNGPQLLRVASLMDLPGICLLHWISPDRTWVERAGKAGTGVMVSPHDKSETCRRLSAFLDGKVEGP